MWSRDTDVLVLLLAHMQEIGCNVWLIACTSKKQIYIPVNAIFDRLPEGSEETLLPFHALTGSDTTSFFCKHTKKTAFDIFKIHHTPLKDIGVSELTEEKIKKTEMFVCKLYKQNVETTDEARCLLFAKAGSPDALPPTSNALLYHMMRVHYQTMVWRQANICKPILPLPVKMGWRKQNDDLIPILMDKEPIPKACKEMISCNCAMECMNNKCSCRKSKLFCTGLCGCTKNGVCMNKDS